MDFRINPRGRPYALELNTIPGMTERSLLPMAALQSGLTYEALVEEILLQAIPGNGTIAPGVATIKARRASGAPL